MDRYVPFRIPELVVKIDAVREMVIVLSIVLTISSVSAAKKEEGVRSIIAFDAQAVVNRGGEVDIPLNAIPNYGNTINFEIQSPPRHGALTPPVNQSDHTATVTYRHDGSSDPLEDSFSFRAASIGRAKSVSYQVSIFVRPKPAHLRFVPPVLDFGKEILSECISRQVTLTNSGGSRAVCKLIFPRGFSPLADDSLTLDEGQSTNITILFSPMELGHLSGIANLLPPKDSDSLLLRGIGVPRFQVSKFGPTDWEIKNLSTNPIIINASGGEGWQMPQEMKLPAKTRQVMTFHQLKKSENPGDQTPLDTRVRISDGLSSTEVELPQPARFIPLNVQLINPSNSGPVLLGSSIPVTFRLHNRSDLTAQVSWTAVSSSGGGFSEPKLVEVRGGEVKEIAHDWKPTIPGDAMLKISVLEVGTSPVDMNFKAKVLSGAIPEKVTADLSSPHSEVHKNEAPSADSFSGTIIHIPPVDDVSWGIEKNWYGKAIPFVSWKSASNQESRIVLEELIPVLSQDTKSHQQVMNLIPVPMDVAQCLKKDDHNSISLREFSPGYHLLRLSIISKDPKIPDATSQISISVPAKPSLWNLLKTPFYLILLVISVLLFRAIRRSS